MHFGKQYFSHKNNMSEDQFNKISVLFQLRTVEYNNICFQDVTVLQILYMEAALAYLKNKME